MANETKFPILFQTLRNFDLEDTRFTKVKIWLMHLEDNMNGSYFTEEAVSRAIPTLSNIPIIGLIDKDTEDFEGHAVTLSEDKEGKLNFKHLTVPYGVIPEYNNAQFEDRVGDDGVTRKYLTVEGLLWNKWEESINILSTKQGLTGQSMEITDYSGSPREDGLINVDFFKFDGACLLGDAVTPAMNNSTVELAFSNTKSVGDIIEEKLAIYAKSNEEGGNIVDEKDIVTQEDDKLNEDGTPIDEGTETEPETPVEETPETPEEPEEPAEPEVEEPEVPEEPEVKPEEPVVPETEEDEETDKPEDKEEEPSVVKETNISDARAAIDEHDEQVVPAIERITIGENVYSIEELTEIAKEHFALKDKQHKAEVDAVFTQYAENLSEEEMTELQKDAYSKEITEIEHAIFAIIGRKTFSTSKPADVSSTYSTIKVPAKTSKSEEPYGGILNK